MRRDGSRQAVVDFRRNPDIGAQIARTSMPKFALTAPATGEGDVKAG
jgi:hypothetical protein